MSVLRGDCVEVMAGVEPDSVDAIVTDPPYDLLSIDRGGSPRVDGTGPFGRVKAGTSGGFMGKHWDGTGVAFRVETWAAALRVAKPGAYLLAFGGTRTVHRMTVALEDAGWIVRDMLVWAYAQGFPKSKASLKPAWEPIVMARKPGASRDLNIEDARIPANGRPLVYGPPKNGADPGAFRTQSGYTAGTTDVGRWPSNILLTAPIFDGGWDGVVGGGETQPSGAKSTRGNTAHPSSWDKPGHLEPIGYGDSGTASRFFLIPKAPTSERVLSDGRRSPHPTQKPEALIRHLVKLITPDGGLVLDPFLGSGTLGVVCDGLGIRWLGIEREAEYADWAEDRIRDGRPRWDVA